MTATIRPEHLGRVAQIAADRGVEANGTDLAARYVMPGHCGEGE